MQKVIQESIKSSKYDKCRGSIVSKIKDLMKN